MKQNDQRAKGVLSKVREIEIRARRLVEESLAGQYHSVFKGRGMDFDRAREYVRGDEVRTIDWNVTARTGSPHVKMFTEERELTMMLIIDVSASLEFGSGSQTKRELAAEVASVMAFSALRNNDKVGLILCTDEVEHYLPPVSGRRHVLRLIRDILYFEPKGQGTNLVAAIDFANRVQPRKSLMLLMSDFIFSSSQEESMEVLRPKIGTTSRRHDLVSLAINDKREEELPNIGILRVEDSEDGEIVSLNTGSKTLRESFKAETIVQRDKMRRLFTHQGVDFLELKTDEPYQFVLKQFFSNREQRAIRS